MEYDVVVVGGGPVGLMVAGELELAGVRTLVLEKLLEPTGHDRAGVLHIRTLESLDLRGLLDRFLDGMTPVDGLPFAGMFNEPLRFTEVDAHHRFSLLIPQSRTEELLGERAVELGVGIRRGHEALDLHQDADGVTVDVAGPDGNYRVRARYLVGCDGSRSTVRKLAGIPFPGLDPTVSAHIGYVTLAEKDVPKRWERTGTGQLVLAFPPEGGIGRIVTVEYDRPPGDRRTPPTLDDLRAAAHRVSGRELDLTEPVLWLSRFSDASRQAERYREGRVLLAGDAAHIHFPIGGQGLNTGLQDALNLGWKLAAQVHGWAPEGLLDSYHAERYPVAERVLLNTRMQLALMNPDENHVTPLRDFFQELMTMPSVNRHLTELVTGVGVRYPIAEDDQPDPLLGRFLPALELGTEGGTTRTAELLRGGRSVLIDLADRADLRAAAEPWAHRVDVVSARSVERPCADALLVRPDGYVGWVSPEGGRQDAAALRGALRRWCGEPR